MLDLVDLAAAGHVVELGAGTGVYTGEILARLGADGQLLAFEIDPKLARGLSERFSDRRLRVVCDSAERLQEHLDGATADVVVSALPFTSLGRQIRQRILTQTRDVLAPGGRVVVLQYSPLIQAELRRFFPSVRCRISPFNVPPAFVFACSGDGTGDTAGTPKTRPQR